IVYDGEPIPAQKLIPKSGGAYTEDWVVHPGSRGVKNVVVWLAPEPTKEQWERLKDTGPNRLRVLPSFAPAQVFPGLTKKGAYTLTHAQDKRAYVPHVLAVQAGSDLSIRNASNAPEEVQWLSRENGDERPVIPPGKERAFKDLRVEPFEIWIASSRYDWMRA